MSAINKVHDQVLQTMILPCLSGKELALIVKKTNKQWKTLVESRDFLVARILEARLATKESSKRVFSFFEARSWSTPRDDDGWSTY